jgi:hypothetical protein
MNLRVGVALLVLLAPSCGAGGPSFKGEPVSRVVKKVQEARDPVVQRGQMAEFLKAGEEAAPVWVALLRHEDPVLAAKAADSLATRASGGGPAEPPPAEVREALLAATSHPTAAVRAAAIRAVAANWAEDATLAPAMVKATVDPDREVCRAALRALRRMGTATGGLDLGPLQALRGREPALAHDVGLALAACGDGSPATVRSLAAELEGKDAAAALEAAQALALLGPRAAAAAPVLARALPGAPEGLAVVIADALGMMGKGGADAAAVEAALGKAQDRRNESVAVAATLALVRLGRRDPKGSGVLSGGVNTPGIIRVRAAEGLVLIGREESRALTALSQEVAAPRGNARAAAADALGRLAAAGKALPTEARTGLEEAAKSPDLDLRRAAKRALGAR